ncbi:hypothetical protein WSK_3261 [Novosphingobium sp. Rr 2-17]|uniref:hypothetical protein n=1 Tax=Novosphingobium sp. Rr 2-17 TaxID=555793 RepID=UPI0002698BED|nr:hypothetical protein [Novosphingobium sp. Rr 2-17]EIZ78123.1 hypothetical protein WSK_3261 [Novosphingobium sp. Rr 2-17]
MDGQTGSLALVFGLEVGGNERVIVAADCEPVWAALLIALPSALPGVPDITPLLDALVEAPIPLPMRLYRSPWGA